MEDAELLAKFVRGRSEEAFRTLVDRHISMVYAVCLRQLRDPHWAEDVSQAVFILLAKKAAHLKPKVILGGWLYRTAVFACSNARELKRTRTFHETRVEMPMQNSPHDRKDPLEQAELESLLDEGLTELNPAQREVIIQRFFENKTLAQIAKVRGQSLYATEKALQTGLKKVRRFLAGRGVNISAVFLAAFLTRQALAAAPVGLAAAATTAAVSGGVVVSSSVGVLVKQLVQVGGRAKLLTALASGVTCLLLATLALAFTAAPRGPALLAAAGPIATSSASRSASLAEIDDLLGTLRRTEAALRRMDQGALAREIVFTDARAAGQWEKMSRLFESNAALKAAATAHFGPAGAGLTAIPTFDDRLDQIVPLIDAASSDFRILGNRAVCRFSYQGTDVAGGAIYFLRIDGAWRIDAATTLDIFLEGSLAGSPRRALESLDDSQQQAVLDRMNQLDAAFRQVAADIASGELHSVDEAGAALQQLDIDIGNRAFFSLSLRRDQNEQPRF